MDTKYCLECENPFLPGEVHEDNEEFRLCSECKKEHPEVMEYLNKYVYEPQKNSTWTPFEERRAKLMRKLQILESDVDMFKNIYCEDEAELEVDRVLDEMLKKCMTLNTTD